MILRLDRTSTGPHGTFGTLTGLDFDFYTGELPWRENLQSKSCIPPGAYKCVWQESPRFGFTYEVTGVPGRSHVLIHSGNFSGNTDLGLKSHVEGCILLGKAFGVLSGQKAVLRSKGAIKEFHAHMKEQPFELHIAWA